MSDFILKELKKFLKSKNKNLAKSRILLVGLSYKPGIADMRNSLNFKIYKFCLNIVLRLKHDPFVENEIKNKYGI